MSLFLTWSLQTLHTVCPCFWLGVFKLYIQYVPVSDLESSNFAYSMSLFLTSVPAHSPFNLMWCSVSVICRKSVVFPVYSCFLYQWNLLPRYNFINIIECGIKYWYLYIQSIFFSVSKYITVFLVLFKWHFTIIEFCGTFQCCQFAGFISMKRLL
jgi:hypothetical protein